MFTAFYCSAELWGDVVLSLLFWGLANEMTSIEEAPVLYPLFGIGANVSPALQWICTMEGLFCQAHRRCSWLPSLQNKFATGSHVAASSALLPRA